MSIHEDLLARLPSLYRPEPEPNDCVGRLFAAVAAELEQVRSELMGLMQAHTVRDADRYRYHPYFQRQRELAGRISLTPADTIDVLDPAGWRDTLSLAPGIEASALVAFLRDALDDRTRAEIDQPETTPTPALIRRLLRGLNRAVRGPVIFTTERFSGIVLPAELREPLPADATAATRIQRNREVLIAAFPDLLGVPRTDHGYVDDLGRLAAVLGLTPRFQPAVLRETAEAFRHRVRRTVALYRLGLGTVPALRRAVRATLPVAAGAAPEARDRRFTIEEGAPLELGEHEVATAGEPAGMVGPLMRWISTNGGSRATRPTIYIEGVAPLLGEVEPTEHPAVERYDGDDDLPPVAVAYLGTVAPNEVLRLCPAYDAWFLGDATLQRARSQQSAPDADPDPWRWGPRSVVADAPVGAPTAFARGVDGVLWLATDTGAGAELWRFDGRDWRLAITTAAPVRDMWMEADVLWLGTDSGAWLLDPFPVGGAFAAELVAGTETLVVHAIVRRESVTWLATSRGLGRLPDGGSFAWFGLGPDLQSELAVFTVAFDANGMLFAGTALGLFQYWPDGDRWAFLAGGARSDQKDDWQPFSPGAQELPGDEDLFLPAVHAVLRGDDGSLWLGTEAGLARYAALAVRGTTYETVLQAFPEFGDGPVRAMRRDERGLVWFCTERGVLVFDGQDFCQPDPDGDIYDWLRLGSLDDDVALETAPRGVWRYVRGPDGGWERREAEGFAPVAVVPVTRDFDAIRDLLFAPAVWADLGVWQDQRFIHQVPVPESDLRARYKPSEDRIVDGGVPFIPELPPGTSTWRYLRHEDPEPPEYEAGTDRPAWTAEGRLLPEPLRPAPVPGRYEIGRYSPDPGGTDSVYAFAPAARLRLRWRESRELTVLVRLMRLRQDEAIDPAVIDEVRKAIRGVRPLGVHVALAIEEVLS
ncbi:hypothetical protein SCOR_07650 [Sulfidibacter corallicola]|uniref:Uncharacterized protein n=1 Tax=Sulfidibacter corallicola TaxID=2818388 RepID=A0A8A4TP88_SULCO|nr:hypothetical protein [Sulfidibacter corallicola]QTD51363.1 hypothetical protein J3U87_02745 [Sulfidibacter corallicola]